MKNEPMDFINNHIAMSNQTRSANAQQETANRLGDLGQKLNQMSQATFGIIEEQQKANKLQEESNQLLKLQILTLTEQNKEQAKQIKKDAIWNKIAWGSTTVVALASIIIPLLVN